MLTAARYTTHPKFLPYPAKFVSLRGAEEDEYCVVDVTRVGKPGGAARILEHIEVSRAWFELYEGAVVRSPIQCGMPFKLMFDQFIHQGVTFVVCTLVRFRRFLVLISHQDYRSQP